MSNPGFVLSPLIAAGMALVLMILVFPAIYRDRSRRIFLFVLLSLQLWAVTTFLLRSSRTLQAALIYDRLMTVFLLSLFATFLHFCHLYTGRRSRWPIYLLYAGFAAAAGTGLLTDLVIRDVRRLGDGYAPQVGPLSYVFFGIMQLLLVANMIRMLRAARREISTFHRKRYLLLGLVVVLPLAGSAADGFGGACCASWSELSSRFPLSGGSSPPTCCSAALETCWSSMRYRCSRMSCSCGLRMSGPGGGWKSCSAASAWITCRRCGSLPDAPG
jgi:hypothetical protein